MKTLLWTALALTGPGSSGPRRSGAPAHRPFSGGGPGTGGHARGRSPARPGVALRDLPAQQRHRGDGPGGPLWRARHPPLATRGAGHHHAPGPEPGRGEPDKDVLASENVATCFASPPVLGIAVMILAASCSLAARSCRSSRRSRNRRSPEARAARNLDRRTRACSIAILDGSRATIHASRSTPPRSHELRERARERLTSYSVGWTRGI